MAHIIPLDYVKNEIGLVVKVKITNKIKVICICYFNSETAKVLKYSNSYNRDIHLPILNSELNYFGFKLVIDETLAYNNWLYNARMFSNRI